MSSGYIPPEGQPGPDEILQALREAVSDNARIRELPEEEVARQLVLEGYLQEEPSPVLVAEMLGALETEELSEKGNPTWTELEPDRLREVVTRLMEAQQEALETIGQALEPEVGEGMDEGEQAEASEHLEAALEDVLAILEGAQEDAQALLEGDT